MSVLSLGSDDDFDMEEIEDVGEDADIIWGVLKSFSILSVRDRSGSIHRLLQQAVQDSHEKAEAREAISRCLWALSQLWCYREDGDGDGDGAGAGEDASNAGNGDADRAGRSKYSISSRDSIRQMLQRPEAGRLVEHIKGATKHALALGVQQRVCAYLLTEAGIYISVALSQFREAQVVLLRAMTALDGVEVEQQQHHGASSPRSPASSAAAEATAAAAAAGGGGGGGGGGSVLSAEAAAALTLQKAKTLHHLGMVSRYLGDYAKSEECLLDAQSIRTSFKLKYAYTRQQDEVEVEADCAKTLYELGVTRTKQKDPVGANAYLQQALVIQRHLGVSTSSTLYQLAVIAVVDKPPRYDDAETLLQEVLAAEGQDGAARSATLQQLGRVASRRGHLDVAGKYFEQALAGYQGAYNSKLHVNIASVHQALGTLFMNKKEHASANVHLLEALEIRTKLYGGDTHQDVTSTLRALGMTHRAIGQNEQAAEYFLRERLALEALLSTGRNHRFLAELQNVVAVQRSLAKETGDKAAAKMYTQQLKALKQQQMLIADDETTSGGGGSGGGGGTNASSVGGGAVGLEGSLVGAAAMSGLAEKLTRLAAKSRGVVRAELLASMKAKKTPDFNRIVDATSKLVRLVAEVEAVLNADAAGAGAGAEKDGGDVDSERVGDRRDDHGGVDGKSSSGSSDGGGASSGSTPLHALITNVRTFCDVARAGIESSDADGDGADGDGADAVAAPAACDQQQGSRTHLKAKIAARREEAAEGVWTAKGETPLKAKLTARKAAAAAAAADKVAVASAQLSQAEKTNELFKACDALREVLRACGLTVSDSYTD